MIQDIWPSRLRNEYQPSAKPKAGEPVLYVRGQEAAVRGGEAGVDEGGHICFPRVGEPGVATEGLTFLFLLDDVAYWLAPDAGAAEPPEGCELVHNRTLRLQKHAAHADMLAFYTAVHLADWYAKSRFCGRCGKPMAHHAELRAMECPSCGNLVFPRINPAVIVAVRDPERTKIVLTRYARGRYMPIDALVAGFVEIGETVEECVKREVREELGLEVKNITYYKSQPWGVAGDILSGFWCDVDGDPTLHMDATDLGRAVWASPEEVVGQGDTYSLTNEMMCLWRDQQLGRA